MLIQLGLSQSKRTYPKPRQIYDFEVTAPGGRSSPTFPVVQVSGLDLDLGSRHRDTD